MGAGTLFNKRSTLSNWPAFRQSGLSLKSKTDDDLSDWRKFVQTNVTDTPILAEWTSKEKREYYILLVKGYWEFLQPIMDLPLNTDISVTRHPAHPHSTILQVAAQSGYAHYISERFSNCKPSGVNRLDYKTRVGILTLAIGSSSQKTVETLLRHGADPKTPGFQDRTPLHQALRDGRDHLVPAFEAYFKELRGLPDEFGDTPDTLLAYKNSSLENIVSKYKSSSIPSSNQNCASETTKMQNRNFPSLPGIV